MENAKAHEMNKNSENQTIDIKEIIEEHLIDAVVPLVENYIKGT